MTWYRPSSWKQQGEATPTGMVPMQSRGRPDWKFEKWITEAYQTNSAARACVNQRWAGMADLPLQIVNSAGDTIERPNVMKLLKTPNKRRYPSWMKFLQATGIYYDFDGNTYAVMGGTKGNPVEMSYLRPDKVTIELSKDNKEIQVYWYQPENGDRIPFEPEQVFHFKSINVLNDLYGRAIIEPAALGIDQDNLASEWNASILQNMGAPSMFLVPPPNAPEMTPKQVKQLEKVWNERRAGSKNAGVIVTVGGGFEPKIVSWNAKDLDWLKGVIQAQVRIATVCGVPPELIGIQGQKTYANFKEARKFLFINTIIPLARMYLSELSTFLSFWFNDEFEIIVDTSKVEAIQEDQELKWTRVGKAVNDSILTINEGRAELGFDDTDGGDVILVNANKIPLDAVSGMSDIQGGVEPPPEEPPEDPPDEEEDEDNE